MNYIFLYPSRNLGGAQLLFYRAAKIIADQNKNVFYIDYPDGYIAQKIKNEELKIGIIDFTPGQKINIPKNSRIITPLSMAGVIGYLRVSTAEAKVLFWCLHPLNVLIQLFITKSKIKYGEKLHRTINKILSREIISTKERLEKISDKGSLFFMDSPNFNSISKFFNADIKESYLPIFLNTPSHKVNQEKKPQTITAIAWLGRIDLDSKLFILRKIIGDYLSSGATYPLHIIGDGSGKIKIQNEFLKHKDRIFFIGEVNNKDLDQALQDINVVFSMGTSCLEAAARSKVTIKVDAFYSQVPENYKYTFFHDVMGYDLGQVIDKDKHFRGHTFNEVISAINLIGVKALGDKSHAAYLEKYTESGFQNSLESAIESSTLSLSDCKILRSKFDYLAIKIRGVGNKRNKIL